jgi:hypothetical protein
VLHRARYFRVIEALHTAVTSSSHTSLATRVLGEVPILPDGSAYFEAPGDTPLFLEPVDAAGRRWSSTGCCRKPRSRSARSSSAGDDLHHRPFGEVKSCNGCHAPQHEAVGSAARQRRWHPPVSVERDLTDLLYRRNDPDEYRASARIGESARTARGSTALIRTCAAAPARC